jgi:ABC-type multidrug transport system ATPase subunit
VLILDEATSSVDTRTEVLVQKAMRALRSDRTSFVIAHRLSIIRDADLILMMEAGQIVEQGTDVSLLAAGRTTRSGMRRTSRRLRRRSDELRLRSTAGAAAFARQAREEGRLLDGCKWDHQPLAAIKFHIRIRGAPCVGFFSCHFAQSFSLGHALLGWELLFFLFRRRWACHQSSRHR